jgi:hypothetical protein
VLLRLLTDRTIHACSGGITLGTGGKV